MPTPKLDPRTHERGGHQEVANFGFIRPGRLSGWLRTSATDRIQAMRIK